MTVDEANVPVNNGFRKCVVSVLQEIVFGKFGIFVHVEFEEFAVNHVEMFVREIIQDLINVGLFINVHTCMK